MKSLNHRLILIVTVSTATIAFLIVILKSLAIIPTGYVGFVDSFGNVSKQILKPGINLVNPLTQVEKLSIRTQELKETLESPSKEGLILTLDISILYRLDAAKAEQVYRTIGSNYEQVVLIPQLRSLVRQVTASYDAKALYTSQRQQISQQIHEELNRRMAARGIIVEDTLLRKLDLPQKIREAVAQKLQAEQQSEQMKFTLEKERQEAERKRIEARGIADSQQIISQGLNDKILQLRRIEATEKFAQSANAKVVIVGAGGQGLPVSVQP